PTQERLKQAKRRRALQLKKWSEYERELNQQLQQQMNGSLNGTSKSKKKTVNIQGKSSPQSLQKQQQQQQQPTLSGRNIKFQDHVVLLDVTMRKDYEDVE